MFSSHDLSAPKILISEICNCDCHYGLQKSRDVGDKSLDIAIPHCDFRVLWKIASDYDFELRFPSRLPVLSTGILAVLLWRCQIASDFAIVLEETFLSSFQLDLDSDKLELGTRCLAQASELVSLEKPAS